LRFRFSFIFSITEMPQLIIMTPVQILINLIASRSHKICFFSCCSYSGNPSLGRGKRECTRQDSNNNKLKFPIGITIFGILIVALALIVGIVLYRKKYWRNIAGVATGRNGVEKKPKPFLYQGHEILSITEKYYNMIPK